LYKVVLICALNEALLKHRWVTPLKDGAHLRPYITGQTEGLRVMSIKNSVIASCRSILAPLTRILIRFGVGAGELNALVEQEYVKSAIRQLAAKNELVSSSRISIITGLPRNIVASIVESLDEESTRRVSSLIHRAQRVLTGWYEDREFQTREGDPALLPVAGQGKTFELLVERYVGGGVRSSGVLKELLATGAIKITRETQVRAMRRTAAAGGVDPETVQQLGEYTGALLTAFEHNLSSGPMEQLAIRGVTRNADPAIVPLFRAQMAKRAEVLVESAEAFLESRVAQPRDDGRAAGVAGEVVVGSFVFNSVLALQVPKPRWQRGLATRLKLPGAARASTAK
jgi:hypothetical protein